MVKRKQNKNVDSNIAELFVIGLAKKFIWAFPYYLTERSE